MRPNTLAEAVDRIAAGEEQDIMLAEFVDSFLLAPDAASRYSADRKSTRLNFSHRT